MSELTTIYLGSRLPKKYDKDSDPAKPTLAKEQPGTVKCRIKIRFSPQSNLSQRIAEAQTCWNALDHGDKPAWISGTDDFMVKVLAAHFGDTPIRPCEPAAGDE